MSAFHPTDARDRLIVALDVRDRTAALRLVEQLKGLAGMFKVGLELYTACGPALVSEIIESGERIFLDLKFHDIPNTVAGAARSAARLGVSIFNLHTLGGAEMMRAAADAIAETRPRPALLGVTVLTSLNKTDLAEVGVASEVENEVLRLALLAHDSGLDGVVASPREIRSIRERIPSERFIILTPGIRPAWSESGDQKRIATPSAALRDGADFIVVGRAITASPDPRSAAERILEEVDSEQ